MKLSSMRSKPDVCYSHPDVQTGRKIIEISALLRTDYTFFFQTHLYSEEDVFRTIYGF